MTQRPLLAVITLLLTSLTACAPYTLVVGLSPGDQKLKTTVVDSELSARGYQVVIIDVSGMLMDTNRPGLFQQGSNPASDLAEKLQKAANDSTVRAVILRINSPGGTVTASDVMYREVLRFKEKYKKPVVTLMMDVAASGGYYLACSSDRIVAYPTTVTASIGVILQTVSLQPGLSRIGITTEAITSGPNKDAGSPFSVMSEEQRAVLKAMVGDFYKRFTDVVRTRRPNIPADKFAMVTDGRIVSGDQALALGLIDQLGDLRDAFTLAKQLAKIEHADLVIYHRPLQYVASPYAQTPLNPNGSSSGAGTQINLLQLNLPDNLAGSSSGFYYLWDPSLK